MTIAIGLVWRDARLLIARRKSDGHLPGLWEFPGGKRKPEESLEACVVREVEEELGIRVRVLSARNPIRFGYPDQQVKIHPFDCEWLSGEPQTLGCAEWRWVKPEELSQYALPPANDELVKQLAAGR